MSGDLGNELLYKNQGQTLLTSSEHRIGLVNSVIVWRGIPMTISSGLFF
jgi:hypothetical protein